MEFFPLTLKFLKIIIMEKHILIFRHKAENLKYNLSKINFSSGFSYKGLACMKIVTIF